MSPRLRPILDAAAESKASFEARVARLERLDEARWAVDHINWPDGRKITLVEKASARDVLRADRIARTRTQS